MQVTFTYNPDEPEDKYHLARAYKALDMYLALYELSEVYRSAEKFGAALPTRTAFNDLLWKHNIDLYDLGG